MKISGLVVTLNEAQNIERCLNSLNQFCDEVVVIDSGSTDETVKIAESKGAKVFVHPWLGHGAQRNFGLSKCLNSWVFSLDADEEVSPELATRINAIFESTVPQKLVFSMHRKNFIGKTWITHSGWHPDIVLRLFNKESNQFNDRAVHEKVVADSEDVSLISGAINHYSYDTISDLFERADLYAHLSAKELARSSCWIGTISPVIHGISGFFKKFVLQLGILHGATGFAIAKARFHNAHTKYKKALQLRSDEKQRKQ